MKPTLALFQIKFNKLYQVRGLNNYGPWTKYSWKAELPVLKFRPPGWLPEENEVVWVSSALETRLSDRGGEEGENCYGNSLKVYSIDQAPRRTVIYIKKVTEPVESVSLALKLVCHGLRSTSKGGTTSGSVEGDYMLVAKGGSVSYTGNHGEQFYFILLPLDKKVTVVENRIANLTGNYSRREYEIFPE